MTDDGAGAIWSAISALRADRPVVPAVTIVQTGTSDAALFDLFMLEDSGFVGTGADGISCTNYEGFLSQMETLVAKELGAITGTVPK